MNLLQTQPFYFFIFLDLRQAVTLTSFLKKKHQAIPDTECAKDFISKNKQEENSNLPDQYNILLYFEIREDLRIRENIYLSHMHMT